MATRRQRFLKMRQKQLRRRLKAERRGWAYVEIPHLPGHRRKWKRAGRKWAYVLTGKQSPLQLLQSSYVHTPVLTFENVLYDRQVRPAQYRLPPVPEMLGAWYLLVRSLYGAPRDQIHGFHARRVNVRLRPPGRMGGDTRRIWLAGQIFIRRGYFPNWDVLNRHPTEYEVTHGLADPVEDAPWPGMS